MKIFNNQMLEGMKASTPIALGYFAVSFALGITAKQVGLNIIESGITSFLTVASAGQYAGFQAVMDHTPLLEVALIIFITNARYVLMSCAFSQKLDPSLPFYHRFFLAQGITDELFALAIQQKSYLSLSYFYSASFSSIVAWSMGTMLGVLFGNILPPLLVVSLGVALFGMFLAIIIPPAKNSKEVRMVVGGSFLSSLIAYYVTCTWQISSGFLFISLTILISSLAAIMFPVKEVCDDE